MATHFMQAGALGNRAGNSAFSWSERLALRHAHPISMIFDIVGVIWAVYFIWNHNWVVAVAIILAARGGAYAATRNIDFPAMATTVLGRLALLHLQPGNLLVQSVGGIVWIWGLWSHSTEVILIGLSLIVAGHAFGWPKVHNSLRIIG